MSLPSREKIDKILKKLSKKSGTLVLDPSLLEPSEAIKYRICQQFTKYLIERNMTQSDLAQKLEIDRSVMNKIIHHRIQAFTVDRLVNLLGKLGTVELHLNLKPVI